MRPAAFLLATSLAFAAPSVASADDAGDIRATITAQLDAFNAGDGAGAYSYAAPNIQKIFPSPEIFMGMVRSGYDPVYHSSNPTFGPLKAEGEGFRQEVSITDRSGKSWVASYTLERQADGSMKITSCTLRKGDDVAV
ncbi:DUF4864 domain-containing protein [Jiella endophytica]|uniref:DUF4864 domain-containing protein n=1 Tax=Jiella endophytica TaxID=2558362 RepID=A0A4Y8RUV0_9HYPH|nr:DUF4864 domain-containing protein [Jiella endophytica]TFF27723.1 DUF4864 domain-containing protein [Jiella endophytica]